MEEIISKELLKVAKDSIKFGLKNHSQMAINTEDFDPVLREKGASFVTLHLHGQLRGCIGSLEAYRPLIIDVAKNAYSSAFSDHRFQPLNEHEFPDLHYHISILTKPSPITFTSEKDLLDQLRPTIDGLIITDGVNRGTFLPSVWEQLPDKVSFFQHLKQKAGLNPHYWSDNITVERYEVDDFEGQ